MPRALQFWYLIMILSFNLALPVLFMSFSTYMPSVALVVYIPGVDIWKFLGIMLQCYFAFYERLFGTITNVSNRDS